MKTDSGIRIGKALLIALLFNGFLYYTGRMNFSNRSLNPTLGLVLSVVFTTLIFTGMLNLLHMIQLWRKSRKK